MNHNNGSCEPPLDMIALESMSAHERYATEQDGAGEGLPISIEQIGQEFNNQQAYNHFE